MPYEDCCSFFVPKHPETKAKMEDINKQDDKFNLDDLLAEVISDIEEIKMNYEGKK